MQNTKESESLEKLENSQVSNLQTSFSGTEQRALKLLGSGWAAELVAQTLGVSPGLISQMLAKPEFAAEVQNKRFQNLQKHTDHDNLLDSMEHKLAKNLEKTLPFIMKPQEQLRALEVLNRLKRRGSGNEGNQEHTASTTVTLLMPTFVTQKFTTNINNQVINANGQVLDTMQSGTLLKQAKEHMIREQQKLLDSQVIEMEGNRNEHERAGRTEASGGSPDDF